MHHHPTSGSTDAADAAAAVKAAFERQFGDRDGGVFGDVVAKNLSYTLIAAGVLIRYRFTVAGETSETSLADHCGHHLEARR